MRCKAERNVTRDANKRLEQAWREQDEKTAQLEKNAKVPSAERNKLRVKIEVQNEKMAHLQKECKASNEAFNVEKARQIDAEQLSQ